MCITGLLAALYSDSDLIYIFAIGGLYPRVVTDQHSHSLFLLSGSVTGNANAIGSSSLLIMNIQEKWLFGKEWPLKSTFLYSLDNRDCAGDMCLKRVKVGRGGHVIQDLSSRGFP